MSWLHHQYQSAFRLASLLQTVMAARCTFVQQSLRWSVLIVLCLHLGFADACWAQSSKPVVATRSRSPINAQSANRYQPRHQVRGSVRSASIEVYDDFESELVEGHEHLGLYGSEINAEDIETLAIAPSAESYHSWNESGCQSCGSSAAVCHCQPFGWLLDWSRGDLWLGSVGFNGASSHLGTAAGAAGQIAGNFGFQEGFNFGTRLPGVMRGQLGSQLGMRFTQSQLDGTSAGTDHRTQSFVTAGLFRRVDYGFQGGLVVDYLHDDWVYKADLLQLRGELSFLFTPCHDLGFRFTDSQQTDDTTASVRGIATPIDLKLSGLNNYRFFYRARLGERAAGSAELQAGFTEESSAILAANLRSITKSTRPRRGRHIPVSTQPNGLAVHTRRLESKHVDRMDPWPPVWPRP